MKLNRFFYLLFRRINLYSTIFIFTFMGVVGLVGVNLSFLDPIEESFQDFEMTDLIFSEFRKKKGLDTNIVLVNIGNLDRKGIAKMLNRVSAQEPAVIGIDAFFREPKGMRQDLPLSMACKKAKNLVLVSRFKVPDVENHGFDSLALSHPLFSAKAESGFANLIANGEHGFRTTRLFTKKENYERGGEEFTEYSFPAKMVSIYKPEAFATLDQRTHRNEVINFSGNIDHFYRFDFDQVLDTAVDLSVMKGKIILFGYMGRTLGERDLTDIFYTPLNEQTGGRSYPDMFGVVVHANIISQILRQDYIEYFPDWVGYLLGVILCYLNVAFFTWVADKFNVYYDVVTKVTQLLEVTGLVGLTIAFFHFFDLKVDLSFAMVAIALCGDLTEVYTASIHHVILKGGSRFRRAQEKMHLSGKFREFEAKVKQAKEDKREDKKPVTMLPKEKTTEEES